jgi:hypothetical protein
VRENGAGGKEIKGGRKGLACLPISLFSFFFFFFYTHWSNVSFWTQLDRGGGKEGVCVDAGRMNNRLGGARLKEHKNVKKKKKKKNILELKKNASLFFLFVVAAFDDWRR